MLGHGEKLPLEGRLDVLKAAGIWAAARMQIGPGTANRDAERFGDALGELTRNIGLARRRILGVLEMRDGRQRKLVGDAWVIDVQCGWQEARADEAVSG